MSGLDLEKGAVVSLKCEKPEKGEVKRVQAEASQWRTAAGGAGGAWEGCEKGSSELMEALTGSFWKAAAGRRG